MMVLMVLQRRHRDLLVAITLLGLLDPTLLSP